MHAADETPPRNLEAEQVVLGCMMLSPEAVAEAEAILTEADFYRPVHGVIFKAITELAARKEPTDPIAVGEALAAVNKLSTVGGGAYLHTCYASPSTSAQAGYYAQIVAEKSMLRRLLEVADTIRRGVYGDGSVTAVELIDKTRDRLTAIEESTASDSGPRLWGQLIPDVFDAIEEASMLPEDRVPGVPTGIVDLDRLLNGFRPGQLIVVAARPGIGKSVATAGFAQHAAWVHKMPSVVFSLEMPEIEIGQRLLSSGASVPLNAIRSGKLHDDEWAKLARIAGETAEAPLFIDGSASLTLADIRARCRKLHRQHGLKLAVVDYLQLVETTRAESRQMAVAAVSRGLKLLAMELGIPVIAVSQLNRGPEQRADKRPNKADLRESGAIENDADVIILLHRDDYYDPESPRAGEIDFIVDKHRNGPTDTITAAAQLHLSRVKDMAVV
jgi:replicative DNA helicase